MSWLSDGQEEKFISKSHTIQLAIVGCKATTAPSIVVDILIKSEYNFL